MEDHRNSYAHIVGIPLDDEHDDVPYVKPVTFMFLASVHHFHVAGASQYRPSCVCGYDVSWILACLYVVQLMPLHPKTTSSLASFKPGLVLLFW